MFRLVHISDPHLGPLPNLGATDYFNKRIIGFLNWKGNRKRHMSDEWRNRLVADFKSARPDHIAVTGDLTNLALESEFRHGRKWLESLGSGQDVSVIPGNHDAYVSGAFKRWASAWAPFMSSDDAPAGTIEFPFLRRRNNIALIGTSTGIAMPPFVAAGIIGRKQADRLRSMLARPALVDDFRIIMIHHPPQPGATIKLKALLDAPRFRKIIRSVGADLILHGHTHLPTITSIAGPNGPVPVVGVAAASNGIGTSRPAARYNQFDIDRQKTGEWTCLWTERGFDAGTGELVTFRDGVPLASLLAQNLTGTSNESR